MSDKREWFYPAGDGSESVGPLTTEQVAEKLRSGELKVDDYIWGTHFADQDWRRIFELEELRTHLPVKQAPKPRMAPPVRVPKPEDDDDVTIVDNPVQREEDHPAIKGENTSPGFVKALAEAPAPEPAAPPPEPEIIHTTVPASGITMDDADRAKVAITVSEVPSPELNERRSIEAPKDDFAEAEIERTNPSMLFRRDPEPGPPPAPSGIREMSFDSFLAKPEPPGPPPAPPPPVPALPPLESDTAFTFRPSSDNTVLTQRPPDPAPLPPPPVMPVPDSTQLTQPTQPTQTLPDLPALDTTKLTQFTQPTPTQSMPVPPMPMEPLPAPLPPISTQDTAIIQRPADPLADDRTLPSVEALLGHMRAEEPPPTEPAPLPPVTATTPEPVTAITFTPILEEPATPQAPVQPVAPAQPMAPAQPVSPIQHPAPTAITQELRTNTQTRTPASGTQIGGGRVSGTGSHMSTRTGNTNFGGSQKTFTPKQEAFHSQTDSFKATHDEPGEYGTENAYRRYPRVPFNTEVIMRDDREYHRFRSIDISEKGVRIKVEDISLFTKGEEITITVRSAPGIGTFSCKGVVMRILRADEGPGYGIFFMQLNPNIRRRITQFVLDQMSARLNRSATRGGPAAA